MRFFYAVFALLLLFVPVAGASPVVLSTAAHYPLSGHLEMFADPSGRLTLKDVLTPENSARFKPIPGNVNQGYTTDTVWVRFSLLRKAPFSDEVYLRLW